MDNWYNFYNFEASFKKFLIAGNISPVTLKNYLSDLRHFLGWFIFKLKVKNQNLKVEEVEEVNVEQILSFIDVSLVEEYKNYLVDNSIPIKTVNRRLSTLRKFFSFCISQGWLKENPAKKIKNLNFFSVHYLNKSENPTESKQGDNSKLKINPILNSFALSLQQENLDKTTIKSYLEVIQEFLSL